MNFSLQVINNLALTKSWAATMQFILSAKACIDNQINLVKQQYLLHMSSQYGELQPTNGPAEIGSLVWGTPANFNRFRVLASLLH